jgi:ankyrin repeat protein
VIKLLLETGKIEVDLKDKDGRTPLLWVAGEGHEAVIKLLLGTGKVEVDLKDSLGRTLLSRAVERKYERRDQAIMNDRVLRRTRLSTHQSVGIHFEHVALPLS